MAKNIVWKLKIQKNTSFGVGWRKALSLHHINWLIGNVVRYIHIRMNDWVRVRESPLIDGSSII